MLSSIRKYPFSLLVAAAIIYLSLFRPPKIDDSPFLFPGVDKLVHGCMYAGLSGMIWLEYLRCHRHLIRPLRLFVGAGLLPAIFGGAIELLQAYATTYRGGDWWDFAANVAGIVSAAFVGHFLLRPYLLRH